MLEMEMKEMLGERAGTGRRTLNSIVDGLVECESVFSVLGDEKRVTRAGPVTAVTKRTV